MNKSGVFKKKRVYFSQISNNALRDETLSLKAKGLYGLIQSYLTLEDFTLYKTFLEKKCKEGRKAFESAWKELKEFGYLVQERNKDENGHFYWTYDLLDDVSHTPKGHTCKNHTTQKVPYGKGGIYNNTKLNNTDLNNTKENNNLQFLDEIECDDETLYYINLFLDIRSEYEIKRHKRVSETNIRFIVGAIQNIITQLSEQYAGDREEVRERFVKETHKFFKDMQNSNKNYDGEIVYFLQVTQYRYFDIQGEDVVLKE